MATPVAASRVEHRHLNPGLSTDEEEVLTADERDDEVFRTGDVPHRLTRNLAAHNHTKTFGLVEKLDCSLLHCRRLPGAWVGDIEKHIEEAVGRKGARRAVVKHVEAAVGMTVDIGDDAARVFAAQFYSSIGFGHSIKRAFEQAKAALMLEGIPEENTSNVI